MTAAGRGQPEAHPLARGASPATVRHWLLPHDAARFFTEHEIALDDARASLDLSAVFDVVERWRRIRDPADDPDAYRRTMRLAAELATGKPSPDDEPLDVTATKAGL